MWDHPAKFTAAREVLHTLSALSFCSFCSSTGAKPSMVCTSSRVKCLMFCSSQHSGCAVLCSAPGAGWGSWFQMCHLPELLPDLLLLCLSLPTFKLSQPVFFLSLFHICLLFVLNSLGTIYPPKQLEAIWEGNLTRDVKFLVKDDSVSFILFQILVLEWKVFLCHCSLTRIFHLSFDFIYFDYAGNVGKIMLSPQSRTEPNLEISFTEDAVCFSSSWKSYHPSFCLISLAGQGKLPYKWILNLTEVCKTTLL